MWSQLLRQGHYMVHFPIPAWQEVYMGVGSAKEPSLQKALQTHPCTVIFNVTTNTSSMGLDHAQQ